MSKPQRITKEQLNDPGFWICFWDLETSSLNGSFGHILCGTVKRLGQPPTTFRIDQYRLYRSAPWDDLLVSKNIRNEIERNHVAVGYNSYNFDIPMLRTRLTANGDRLLKTDVKHVDLYLVTRYRMRMSSNSLESLLGLLKTKQRKTPLEPELWRMAVGGHKQSLDAIAEHNVADVVSLEEAFLKLIPYLDIQFRLIR